MARFSKDQPGGAAHYTWENAGDVVDVDDEKVAADLRRIPGFTEVFEPADPAEPEGGKSEPTPRPPVGGPGSSVKAWAKHAASLGHDVPPGMSKAEIIALVDGESGGDPDGDGEGQHDAGDEGEDGQAEPEGGEGEPTPTPVTE